MDALYNGAIGSFVSGLFGVGIIICAIFSYANSLSTPNPKNELNTPSSTPSSTPSYSWIFLCICGIIFLVISTGLYYMPTGTLKITEGPVDTVGSSYNIFNHKKDGYFMNGE